tara:strand:- start:1157 stop:1801 length:645 start_codon:yes stop_codon:yes gene_type:complete
LVFLVEFLLVESKKFSLWGFTKQGQVQWGKALQLLGYSVCGSLKEANQLPSTDPSKVKRFLLEKAIPKIKNYDAFQDTPWFLIYRELYMNYPDAKFILTTRDENKWILSVQRHFGKNNFAFHKFIYSSLDSLANKELYLERYRKHNEEVRLFFKDNPNFIEIDIQNYNWDTLCNFLKVKVPIWSFPHANKRDQTFVEKQLSRMKRIIKELYYNS